MGCLAIVRLALLVALLSGGWQSAVGRGGSVLPHSDTATKMTKKKGLISALQRYATTMLVAGGLMVSAPQLPVLAQQGEPDAVWTDQLTREVYNSVLYLALAGEEGGYMRHVIYIGDTPDGEHLFAGLYLWGLNRGNGNLLLYGRNGLIADGLERTDVEVFIDPLGDYNDVSVFTLGGLDLGGNYEPIMPVSYPLDEMDKELDAVAYGMNAVAPKSVLDLPLMQRSCKVTGHHGWGVLGVGMNDCVPIEGLLRSSHGSIIFDHENGDMVAFFGELSRKGYATAGNPLFIDYIMERQTPTAVDSRDKLPVTWGAIKAGL